MVKKILTNYRYYVLLLVAGISFINLFAEPTEESISGFLLGMLTTKSTAVVFGLITYALIRYWDKAGKIGELMELCKDDE